MNTETPDLCDGEYADAPFCSGPSDQGAAETPPESGPTCDLADRSARGYCPDESDGHAAELCDLGIANDRCPDVEEAAPEAVELIPPSALERDADGNVVDVSCSLVDECVEEVAEPSPVFASETLPEAGGPVAGLLVPALALVALGTALVRGGAR